MTSPPRLRLLALLLLLLCLALSTPASAQLLEEMAPAAESAEQGLPDLGENFSPFELTMATVGMTGALVFGFWGSDLFGSPSPGMGPPDVDSRDYRFSEWANPDPDPEEQWLWGIPDYGGYYMPILTLGFLSTATIGSELDSTFFLPNYKHELLTFASGFGWAAMVTNAFKLNVGRIRPWAARPNAADYDIPEKEKFLSFPSGHSASAAATSTFLFHRTSDYLRSETFADSGTLTRWGLGYAVPFAIGAAATGLVMYSRIKDQRHWPSDTLVGAIIGYTVMTIFYKVHFDDDGRPRRRH